ncbi:MAG: tyrosine-type recombinase/integrase [Nitrososphaeria archaeon]|nr:tyrosine-type recombinase/integrase [Nitrososphaeria archaeon]
MADRYLGEERDYEADVKKFFVAIKDRPPKTVGLMLSALRSFLEENDVELHPKFWRKVRNKKRGNRAQTLDRIPSNTELRRIVSHMPIQGKALYLSLASSGMRIGEALQLGLDDLDLDSDPVKIEIRGVYTKSGNPRITFISGEAKEAIEEWLKTRNQYLVSASSRSRYDKPVEDRRLFPFKDNTARLIWINALGKADFKKRDPGTKRYTIHPHVLRKFFRTKMGPVIPVDIVEALMGHEGYLTEIYKRYSDEDLAKFYKQGESSLLIFTETGEISKIKQEIDERNKQLQTLVNGLTAENVTLKARIEIIQRQILEANERIEKLEKLLSKAPKLT